MIELITFRLADGVDEATFRAADERFRTGFLYQQPGLARATTAQDRDGNWLALLLWGRGRDADAAANAARTDPAATAFFDLVDAGSMERRRYAELG